MTITLEQIQAIREHCLAVRQPLSNDMQHNLKVYHEYTKAANPAVVEALCDLLEPVVWRDMATAPKDGTTIELRVPGQRCPQVSRWAAKGENGVKRQHWLFLDEDSYDPIGWRPRNVEMVPIQKPPEAKS